MPTIDANWNKVEVSSGKINNRAIGQTTLSYAKSLTKQNRSKKTIIYSNMASKQMEETTINTIG